MKTVAAEQQIHSDRKVQSTWWVRPTNLQAVVVCTKTVSGTLFKDKVKLKSELYEQSTFIHKLIDRCWETVLLLRIFELPCTVVLTMNSIMFAPVLLPNEGKGSTADF